MTPLTIDPAAPIFVVLNVSSGSYDAVAVRATIERVLGAAGREHRVLPVANPTELHAVARRTVEEARSRGGVVVAAGGDGTINAVAQATLGSGCPFGVLPQGTFNYTSRAHGIPADTTDAVRLLVTARAHPIQVGLVNDRLFLVNASVGLYPKLLEDREAHKRQFGRSRFVAFCSGLLTLLRENRQLRLSIEHDGVTRSLRTRTLLVANNRLQLEQLGIPEAPALAEGNLVAINLRPVGTLKMLWLLARGAFGQLGDADSIASFAFKRISVAPGKRSGKRHMKVATDGEIVQLRPPIEFCVSPDVLYLLKPEPLPAGGPPA
jgi:diacylglycerol kinase family enzyme